MMFFLRATQKCDRGFKIVFYRKIRPKTPSQNPDFIHEKENYSDFCVKTVSLECLERLIL